MTTTDQLFADTAHVNDLTPAAFNSGRAALDRALANQIDAQSARVSASRWTGRRKLTLASSAAAVIAAVVIVPVVSFGGRGPGADASAATVLRQAGQAAAAQGGGWPNAAYWHVASSYQRGATTYQRDIWIAHDGNGVLHDTGLLIDPAGGRGGQDMGFIRVGPTHFPAGATSLTWDELYALPTDPVRLAATLRADIRGAGTGDDAELFVIVGDLLRESPAPPTLRQALYDVAADIPGVHVKGQVTDAAGRPGTAVERGGETLVVDTATGQLLADSGGDYASTYLDQGPSETAPALTSH